jgi:hypothetical protein
MQVSISETATRLLVLTLLDSPPGARRHQIPSVVSEILPQPRLRALPLECSPAHSPRFSPDALNALIHLRQPSPECSGLPDWEAPPYFVGLTDHPCRTI